ncbi:hypothetical protein ACQRUO_26330, partial [Kitasatospora sp. LaBMicrA B282]
MVTTRSSGAVRSRGRFGVRRAARGGRPVGRSGDHPVGRRPAPVHHVDPDPGPADRPAAGTLRRTPAAGRTG